MSRVCPRGRSAAEGAPPLSSVGRRVPLTGASCAHGSLSGSGAAGAGAGDLGGVVAHVIVHEALVGGPGARGWRAWPGRSWRRRCGTGGRAGPGSLLVPCVCLAVVRRRRAGRQAGDGARAYAAGVRVMALPSPAGRDGRCRAAGNRPAPCSAGCVAQRVVEGEPAGRPGGGVGDEGQAERRHDRVQGGGAGGQVGVGVLVVPPAGAVRCALGTRGICGLELGRGLRPASRVGVWRPSERLVVAVDRRKWRGAGLAACTAASRSRSPSAGR